MGTPRDMEAAVTDALKRCVGWGAKPERLGVLQALQSLPGMDPVQGLHAAAGGMVIRKFIESRGIDRFSGSYQLFGHTYSANVLKACFRLELAFDRPDWIARRRRLAVIQLLGTNHTADYWARADGPEWELMALLAQQLVDPQHNVHPNPLGEISDAG